MKDLASSILAHQNALVGQTLEQLTHLNGDAAFQLPYSLSYEIVTGMMTSLHKEFESKKNDQRIGHIFAQFCNHIFGKKLPFKLSFQHQFLIIVVLRNILDEWLVERSGLSQDLFHSHSRYLHQIFDQALLKLSQQWDTAFQKVRKDDQTLIEELKLVKNNLQQQVDLLYQIMKDSPLGVVGCDRNLNVQLWNSTASQLTGFQQSDILKKSLLQIFLMDAQNQFVNKINTEAKFISRLRLNIRCKNGDSFPALLSINKFEAHRPKGIYYLIHFLDLRQEKIIKSQVRQIDQLTAVSRLSSAIMHDIRNPVNTIGLNVDGLEQILERNGVMDFQIQDLLDKIHRQITFLTTNLNQYLGYSRLAELNSEPVNLSARLDEFLLEMRLDIALKQVQFHFHRPKIDLYIWGDWIQLRRAFMNLIQNAVEAFQNEGAIWIRLYQRNKRIMVSFRDNGPGIDATKIEKIFEQFYSTKPSGAGLGLFIIREIVKAHQGRVTCVSRPQKGARFTLSFLALNNLNPIAPELAST
ncbi:ATP-binding protein [candidate division KSB1 bacterium]|nr:ATP-binding protein [candidate division KSB1 bacterium]